MYGSRHQGNGSGRSLFRAAARIVTILGAVLGIVCPSYAQEPADPLEHLHERLVKAVAWQADYLKVAEKLAQRTQEWIDDQTSKGQDTAALREALKAFEAGLGQAQEPHQDAVALLKRHEGFNDDGMIVDHLEALNTILKAARSLSEAQRVMWKGMMALRQTTGEWRRTHQPWRTAD